MVIFILFLLSRGVQHFNAYKEQMISTQSPENQVRLREEFSRLLTDLQRNLEPSNRERFGQKLTVFRVNVSSFYQTV
jgi:exportin-7